MNGMSKRLAVQGGPAFARPACGSKRDGIIDMGHEGVTVRLYLAGQALAGLCANFHAGKHAPGAVAELALRIADAVMEKNEAQVSLAVSERPERQPTDACID